MFSYSFNNETLIFGLDLRVNILQDLGNKILSMESNHKLRLL